MHFFSPCLVNQMQADLFTDATSLHGATSIWSTYAIHEWMNLALFCILQVHEWDWLRGETAKGTQTTHKRQWCVTTWFPCWYLDKFFFWYIRRRLDERYGRAHTFG
jgi:hypothetical protein